MFDIYFLQDGVDMDLLKNCIRKYIFEDVTLKGVNNMDEVIKRIEKVFANKQYIQEVEKSGKNWMGLPVEVVFNKDLELLRSIEF